MIDGQLDRQIFPDVIDMETFEVIIARFLLNLFGFSLLTILSGEMYGLFFIAVSKGVTRMDRTGLSGAGAGKLLARLWDQRIW